MANADCSLFDFLSEVGTDITTDDKEGEVWMKLLVNNQQDSH
jgi:hypothetical protein